MENEVIRIGNVAIWAMSIDWYSLGTPEVIALGFP